MRVESFTKTFYRTPDGAEHADLPAAKDHATDLAIDRLASATVEEYRAALASNDPENPVRRAVVWFGARAMGHEDALIDLPTQNVPAPTEQAPGIGHNGGPALDEPVAAPVPVVDMEALAATLAGHG